MGVQIHKYYKIFVAAILLILGVGVVVAAAKFNASVADIEVLDLQTPMTTQEASDTNLIVVDISGEVSEPGVYKLPKDSRVEDVLVASGGILESADSEWISKSLNKASKLSDGQKIFIPTRRALQGEAGKPPVNQSEVLSANNQVEGVSGNLQTSNPGSTTININNASQGELESLWGIGPKTAQKIIEQRPYSTIEELLTRKIVKSNVYERIKSEISVY